MQWERRREPYPWSWEPSAAVLVAGVCVLVLGTQLGRSLANWLAGGSWWMPPPNLWVATSPSVWAGDAVAGLQGRPGPFASAPLLWRCLIGTEGACVLAGLTVSVAVWRRWGGRRMRGVASRAEVGRLLGRRRLRRIRAVVRPDLYGRRRRR